MCKSARSSACPPSRYAPPVLRSCAHLGRLGMSLQKILFVGAIVLVILLLLHKESTEEEPGANLLLALL